VKPIELSAVARYVSERTGSSLSRQQLGRLDEAIAERKGRRDDFGYLEHLKSTRGAAELAELMSVISVHKTDLFRDEVQLEAVRRKILPQLVTEHRVLRVWSAGCATGEEVATLLILLDEAGADATSTVLGTDIAATALKAAQPLVFAHEVMKRVPSLLRERYFVEKEGRSALIERLAARAMWMRHNLMDHPYPLPPTGGGFDLIFCRNVLIYFTEGAWERVVDALVDRLRPGGVLVLGAAEPILGKNAQLEVLRLQQAFCYRRRLTPKVDPPAGVPLPNPSPAWVAPAPSAPRRPSSPDLPPVRSTSSSELPVVTDPREEGVKLFENVLEWSAAGEKDEDTEKGLRKALYLAPDLAPARYLLGLLLEQRQANADASSEYRRALAMLNEGKARPTPFFLNPERLKKACELALKRLGYR
jgi:chemotaxis protein methyltransferase CheR